MILGVLMGGLGNQLFQIFATISYALKNKISFTFLNVKNTIGITYRQTYWNTFLQHLSPYLIDTFPLVNNISQTVYNLSEENFSYKELPLLVDANIDANIDINANTNIKLNGYFQSYKYFEEYFSSISKLIKLEKQKALVRTKDINTANFDNTISIHFRIGDYKGLTQFHPIMTKQYYENSLKYILDKIYINNNDKDKDKDKQDKKIRILYFCEEKDKSDVDLIIESLKRTNLNTLLDIHFECVNFVLQDWEQMLLMSTCKYNIIANSTFSWWGGYFNSDKDKIVCYPNVWFNSVNLPHDTSDLFPPDWTKIIV